MTKLFRYFMPIISPILPFIAEQSRSGWNTPLMNVIKRITLISLIFLAYIARQELIGNFHRIVAEIKYFCTKASEDDLFLTDNPPADAKKHPFIRRYLMSEHRFHNFPDHRFSSFLPSFCSLGNDNIVHALHTKGIRVVPFLTSLLRKSRGIGREAEAYEKMKEITDRCLVLARSTDFWVVCREEEGCNNIIRTFPQNSSEYNKLKRVVGLISERVLIPRQEAFDTGPKILQRTKNYSDYKFQM